MPLWSSPLETADGRTLPTHGEDVCNWIEDNCVYGEGDYFGQKVVLRPFQRRWIYRLYEFWPETGKRRYRRALWGLGKGNGKTPIAACVGAYELAGRVHIAPRVIIGAASLKQANLVFGDLTTIARESPELSPLLNPYDLEIRLKGEPGVAERVAAEAGTNDGARATAFIADELHEWKNRTARVYLIIEGAIAKRRDAFTFAISTAGVKGDGSPLEELYEYGKKVSRGEIVDDEFLFEWYEAPENLDLNDEAQWEQAVMAANPAAGDFLDIDNIRHRFRTMPEFEFRRYHLNQWTTAVNQWIALEKWDEGSEKVEFLPKEPVWVGVAGHSRRDATAVYLAKADDDSISVMGRVFEPPEGEEIVSTAPVREHIRDLGTRYDVRQVRYTPLFWELATQLASDGFEMVEVNQTPKRMASYSQALFDAAVEGKLNHAGDSVLRRQVQSAGAKPSDAGWILQSRDGSISALVAAAMAVEAARDNAGEKKQPGRLVTF